LVELEIKTHGDDIAKKEQEYKLAHDEALKEHKIQLAKHEKEVKEKR
jgi:hypothetical protein